MFKVVHVKSKMSTIRTSISSEAIYPFLELQYSYPSWAQTSEYGTVQRAIEVYGQYKHGPYLFMGSPQSSLTPRGLCSVWDLSVAVHAVLSVTVTFVKITFTSYFTSSAISTVQKCSFRSVRRWLLEYNCLLWVVWASWKLAWLSEANKMTLKKSNFRIYKSIPFQNLNTDVIVISRFVLYVVPGYQWALDFLEAKNCNRSCNK